MVIKEHAKGEQVVELERAEVMILLMALNLTLKSEQAKARVDEIYKALETL